MRILVIGCGSMGLKHIKNAGDLGHEVLTVDISGKDPSSKDGRPHYKDLEIALSHPQPFDAAIVSTPSHLHYEQAKALLEHKVPVLVEKPLTTSAATAKELQSIAEELQVPAMVAQSYRFHPGIQLLMGKINHSCRLLQEEPDSIGVPLHVIITSGHHLSQWHKNRDYKTTYMVQKAQGGGVKLTSTSHIIDIIRYVFGEIEGLEGQSFNRGGLGIDVEDLVQFHGTTLHGTHFSCVDDFLCHKKTSCIEVIGDDGSGILDLVANTLVITTAHLTSTINYSFDGNQHYMEELTRFLDMIKYKRLVDAGDAGPMGTYKLYAESPVPLGEGVENLRWLEKIH